MGNEQGATMIHHHEGPPLIAECDLHLATCPLDLSRQAWVAGSPIVDLARIAPDLYKELLGKQLSPAQLWICGQKDMDGVRRTFGVLALEKGAKKERLEGQCIGAAVWLCMLAVSSGFCPRRAVEIRTDEQLAPLIEHALHVANLDIENAGDYWVSVAA
jgi:hypothetical protein